MVLDKLPFGLNCGIVAHLLWAESEIEYLLLPRFWDKFADKFAILDLDLVKFGVYQ